VFALSPVIFTETVSAAPLVVPLAGETESQEEPLVTAAEYVTLGPVAVTLKGCEAGVAPPTVPVKVKAAGVGTLVTLNVTATCTFVAPEALSVMVPLYVPGPGTLVGSAITEIAAPPAVPVGDDTLSQLPPELVLVAAPNVTDELGEVVTERFCDSSEVEFTELKVNAEELGTNVTASGVTVRDTATVCVELLVLLQGVVEAEELEAAV
jgi:hypothetical protein